MGSYIKKKGGGETIVTSFAVWTEECSKNGEAMKRTLVVGERSSFWPRTERTPWKRSGSASRKVGKCCCHLRNKVRKTECEKRRQHYWILGPGNVLGYFFTIITRLLHEGARLGWQRQCGETHNTFLHLDHATVWPSRVDNFFFFFLFYFILIQPNRGNNWMALPKW